MKKVENGKYVKVHYTGKFDDGEVFDSSTGSTPLEVHMGASEVIPGFEKALIGMSENERKTVVITPEDAYGQRDENLEQSFQRSDFPADFAAQMGEMVVLESEEHGQFPAVVKSIDGQSVVLDMNHPLAGKELTFDLEVVEISDQPSTPKEGSCGHGCGCSHSHS
jgi:peptidylprolyl isomerase